MKNCAGIVLGRSIHIDTALQNFLQALEIATSGRLEQLHR